MIISDLNHVEVVSESTSIVGGFNLGNDYSNVYFNRRLNIAHAPSVGVAEEDLPF